MSEGNGYEPLRLNIGSGATVTMKGYVNVDAKFGDVAYPLKYQDGTVDEIYASHILEHFSFREIPDVAKDWVRALKPGGVLKIAVPDFNFIVQQYIAGNPHGLPIASYLMGGQQDEYDQHKAIFDEPGLRGLLADAGLEDIQPWTSEVRDCAALAVSLNLMGRKPRVSGLTVIGEQKLQAMNGLPRCPHGAILGRASESAPSAGVAECGCCHGSFGTFKPGVRFCSLCLLANAPDAQVASAELQQMAVSRAKKQSDDVKPLAEQRSTPYKAFVATIKSENHYSQFSEDSAIEAIFERIGTESRFCVECGAADGLYFSNTRRLIEQGWGSLQIEADDERFAQLKERYKDFPRVTPLHKRVGLEPGERLDDILRDCPPVDLLVLDVDGQEYHILNSLSEYKPRVLIVEFNPQVDPLYIPEPGAEKLDQAGLEAIGRAAQARGYEAICRTHVNLICVRRDLAHLLTQQVESPPGRHFVAGEWRDRANLTAERVRIRPAIVMSTPRYGPLDAAEAISEIGMHIHAPRFKSGGAFWEQGLTRSIELALTHRDEEGEMMDVIVSVDYDTFATPDDAKRLIQLLYQNPQYDCIVPLQSRRGRFVEILATTTGPVDMTQALVPIATGHFGLTVFRRRVFETLRKPWLLGKTDPQGGWNDGRTDADIHFWQNFNDCGLKAALATSVVIGHGEDAVVYPRLVSGRIEKVYISVFEWLAERSVPENAGVIG